MMYKLLFNNYFGSDYSMIFWHSQWDFSHWF